MASWGAAQTSHSVLGANKQELLWLVHGVNDSRLPARLCAAQLPPLQTSPSPAVETIGMRADAWNRTDGLRGFGDNQMNQNEKWASESQGPLPIVQPIDVPVSGSSRSRVGEFAREMRVLGPVDGRNMSSGGCANRLRLSDA